jgi:hypothetical protein
VTPTPTPTIVEINNLDKPTLTITISNRISSNKHISSRPIKQTSFTQTPTFTPYVTKTNNLAPTPTKTWGVVHPEKYTYKEL